MSDAMRRALEPFAEAAQFFDSPSYQEESFVGINVLVHDLRAARAALQSVPDGGEAMATLQEENEMLSRIIRDNNNLLGQICDAIGAGDDDNPVAVAKARMEEIAVLEDELAAPPPPGSQAGTGEYSSLSWIRRLVEMNKFPDGMTGEQWKRLAREIIATIEIDDASLPTPSDPAPTEALHAGAEDEVSIDYTNWRGERRVRRVRPSAIMFQSNEWHAQTQWLLYAFDCEDYNRPLKSFALSSIHSWLATSPNPPSPQGEQP